MNPAKQDNQLDEFIDELTDEPLDRVEGAAGSFSYPTACRAQEGR